MLFFRRISAVVAYIEKCIHRRGILCGKKLSYNPLVCFQIMIRVFIVYGIFHADNIGLIGKNILCCPGASKL